MVEPKNKNPCLRSAKELAEMRKDVGQAMDFAREKLNMKFKVISAEPERV